MESKSSPAHCSCGELRSSLLVLGTRTTAGRHTIYWSNDYVRIATEVHQAAQPLLLCNANAGIQRARKARITAIRPPNALCATAPWISTGSLNSQRGSAIASRISAFERACANTQSNLSHFQRSSARGARRSPGHLGHIVFADFLLLLMARKHKPEPALTQLRLDTPSAPWRFAADVR